MKLYRLVVKIKLLLYKLSKSICLFKIIDDQNNLISTLYLYSRLDFASLNKMRDKICKIK